MFAVNRMHSGVSVNNTHLMNYTKFKSIWYAATLWIDAVCGNKRKIRVFQGRTSHHPKDPPTFSPKEGMRATKKLGTTIPRCKNGLHNPPEQKLFARKNLGTTIPRNKLQLHVVLIPHHIAWRVSVAPRSRMFLDLQILLHSPIVILLMLEQSQSLGFRCLRKVCSDLDVLRSLRCEHASYEFTVHKFEIDALCL